MKSLIMWTALALSIGNAFAQTAKLKVGDPAPALNSFKQIKGNPISGFKKGKIYVVDFGATWCVPCKVLIPHLTDIAQSNKDIEVISMFIMEANDERNNNTNPRYVKRVEEYVKSMGSKMSFSVGVDAPDERAANAWVRAAGIQGIPALFVIDKTGHIAWIGTGSTADQLTDVVKRVKSSNYRLAQMIKENEIAEKKKVSYALDKLYLINGNGGNDTAFAFRSVLAPHKGDFEGRGMTFINSFKYIEKFKDTRPESYNILKVFQGRVQEMATPLKDLYYIAYADTVKKEFSLRNPVTYEYPDTVNFPETGDSYGKYWYTPLLEVTDKKPFEYSFRPVTNLYNYSLSVPLEKASADFLQKAMQRDLMTYFGYDVVVEERMMPCWKLQLIDKDSFNFKLNDTIKPKHSVPDSNGFTITHAWMRDLVGYMVVAFGTGYNSEAVAEKAPFVDDTGITSQIDYYYDRQYLKVLQQDKDWDRAQDFYKGLGLKWVKSEKPMKVVIIRDKK